MLQVAISCSRNLDFKTCWANACPEGLSFIVCLCLFSSSFLQALRLKTDFDKTFPQFQVPPSSYKTPRCHSCQQFFELVVTTSNCCFSGFLKKHPRFSLSPTDLLKAEEGSVEHALTSFHTGFGNSEGRDCGCSDLRDWSFKGSRRRSFPWVPWFHFRFFFAWLYGLWKVFVLLLLGAVNNGCMFLRQIFGLDVCVRKPLVVTCGTLVKGTKLGRCCQSKLKASMHDGHFPCHCYGFADASSPQGLPDKQFFKDFLQGLI